MRSFFGVGSFPTGSDDPREVYRGEIDSLIVHDHGIRNVLRFHPGEHAAAMGRLDAVTVRKNVPINEVGLARGLYFLEGFVRQPEPG